MLYLFFWRQYSGTRLSWLATAISFIGMFVAMFCGFMVGLLLSERWLDKDIDILAIIISIAIFAAVKFGFRILTDYIANLR